MKLILNFLFLVLFTSLSVNGFTQSGDNPFQIGSEKNAKPRVITPQVVPVLDTTEQVALENEMQQPVVVEGISVVEDVVLDVISEPSNGTTAMVDSITIEGNPFDINGIPNKIVKNEPIKTKTVVGNPFTISAEPKNEIVESQLDAALEPEGIVVQKKSPDGNLLFFLTTTSLLIFTLLFAFLRSYFSRIYQTFLSSNLLKTIYQKINNSNNYSVFVLLYLIFALNLSIFAYLFLDKFDFQIEKTFSTFGMIFGFVSFWLILRHLVLLFIGNVFPVKDDIGLYNFLLISFNIGIGVVLLPLNLLIAYVPVELGIVILYISIGLLVLFLLYRSIRGLGIAKKSISYHKLHFFLYLCAIEITPTIILVKFLLKLGY